MRKQLGIKYLDNRLILIEDMKVNNFKKQANRFLIKYWNRLLQIEIKFLHLTLL